ncbi:hypothetical protein OGAPHI_006034 [Ogataea philodendri]|uniref:Uncharacterized protein n=1 Tax=Ogataea philodendri TaxID=1378263 RepID=A0A9P8NYJ3_9ASCO|nr:uncharacterized protein OGAPHI_006034 [Ogataea philodendri]KAH3661855.1 hypothetical protein OGAPHI_006034 [Ogataea philodendri]
MSVQKSASLDQPIEVSVPNTIASSPILPELSESVTNLQMAYLFHKKSLLTRDLFGSKLVVPSLFAVLSAMIYHRFGAYLSSYNFRNGVGAGLLNIYHSPFFIQDAFWVVLTMFFFTSLVFLALWILSNFLKYQAEEVPEHMDQYFGLDLQEYAKVSLKTKLRKLPADVKEQVDQMAATSFVVTYRETPIAFIVQQKDADKNYKITGLAVRKVYIKSEILVDLLEWAKSRVEKDARTSIDVYSFESFDIQLLQKCGFVLAKKSPLNSFFLDKLFGYSVNTYVYTPSA